MMTCQGKIYVNGIPLDRISDWYISNTGYVLQLTAPYYEELTVRENILLAALMRLSHHVCQEERFKRVEQVITEVYVMIFSKIINITNRMLL